MTQHIQTAPRKKGAEASLTIHLDGWSRQKLGTALREAYQGDRRVHVAPLRADQGREAALKRISIYGTKFSLTVADIDNEGGDRRKWMSADDTRELAMWAEGQGRSWFRFTIFTGKGRYRSLW